MHNPNIHTLLPEQSDDHQIVAKVENVSVRYRVPTERVGTFKEYVIRRLRGKVRYKEFLALKNVSLEVRAGEVFGLIGANGAGKSTLLRLMARVLYPLEGRVWVKGRVAPLLAMGAGFHPEMSGRENVFLNGTLLGLSQKEIQQYFDEIVDFANLWNFIDAPLRTYSSGMVARLGFSVATVKKPDILIVDEALGVGDAIFQEKSLARIRKFQEEGATTLYVSHSMGTVRSSCQRVAWLHQGEVRFIGAVDEAVKQYLDFMGVKDG
jgi:lipopolysaccharide transport system ATP-binding protein